jgi:hypothetical protein
LVVEPSSHMSRKKAIIAVTKSAYAIFQAPPWWPPWPPFLMRLMMMGCSLPDALRHWCVLQAGFLLLDVAFELGEGRALGRVQHLAAELDREAGA